MEDPKKQRPIEALYVREGGIQPTTANADARTIDVVLSDERSNTVRAFNWREGAVVDQQLSLDEGSIRLDRLNNGAPFLVQHAGHDSRAQIGKIVEGSARVEGGTGARQLVATVVFSRNLDEAAERHVRDIFDGIRRNVSVGFREYAADVTARDEGPDHHYVTDWQPFEGSSVTMGADDGAVFRAYGLTQKGDRMTRNTENETVETVATPDPAEVHRLAAIEADRIVAEREKRAADLRKLGSVLSSRVADVEAWISERDSGGALATFDAIRDREFERAAKAADKPAGKALVNGVRVAAGGHDEAQIRGLGMLGWLMCHRTGWAPDKVRSALIANKRRRQTFATGDIPEAVLRDFDFVGAGARYELRGSLVQLAAECLRADGYRVDDMGRAEVIEHAMGVRGLTGRGLNTTSSFPLLLAETLNTSLRIGYDEYPMNFTNWAMRSDAVDFRSKFNITMGEADDLVPLVEGEEIPTSTMGEAREHYAVVEHGRQFGWTFRLMINDRLGGITELGRKFGAAGNRLMRQAVYGLLTTPPTLEDGLPVFTNGAAASRSINDDPSPAVFSISEADDMRVRFATRQGIRAATTVPHRMRHIMCGTGNETFINQVLGRVVVESRARNTAEQVTESFTGLGVWADPLIDQFDATPIGGGLGTAWFGTDGESVEYAFLQGYEGVQTAVESDFSTRGMRIRATMDFGAGVKDWRGLGRNAGA